jgi:hypothetical protein
VWGQIIAYDVPWSGWWCVILDRDVGSSDELDQVATTPWLLGPVHVDERLFTDGLWQVHGVRAMRDMPRMLEERFVRELGPRYHDPPTRQLRTLEGDVVTDSVDVFHAVDSDQRWETLVRATRARRGLERWQARFDALRAPKAPS